MFITLKINVALSSYQSQLNQILRRAAFGGLLRMTESPHPVNPRKSCNPVPPSSC